MTYQTFTKKNIFLFKISGDDYIVGKFPLNKPGNATRNFLAAGIIEKKNASNEYAEDMIHIKTEIRFMPNIKKNRRHDNEPHILPKGYACSMYIWKGLIKK